MSGVRTIVTEVSLDGHTAGTHLAYVHGLNEVAGLLRSSSIRLMGAWGIADFKDTSSHPEIYTGSH